MEVSKGKRNYQVVVASFLNSVFPYFSVHFLYNHQKRERERERDYIALQTRSQVVQLPYAIIHCCNNIIWLCDDGNTVFAGCGGH